MQINYKLIGKRIQRARKKVNITQEKLAELMDMSVSYISQVERGITKANLRTLDNICTQIGCSLIYILTGKASDEKEYADSDFCREFYKLSDTGKNITIEIMELLSKYV